MNLLRGVNVNFWNAYCYTVVQIMFYNVIDDIKDIFPGNLLEYLPFLDGRILSLSVILCSLAVFFFIVSQVTDNHLPIPT